MTPVSAKPSEQTPESNPLAPERTIGHEITVTPEVAAEHGLTAGEYARIQKILGRDPNITELGIFSVMWSEHCSYKSSKIYLKRLPTRGARVLQGPGENAGAVDIGDGLCAVFKIESHNHPSFVEPFQGAATGVGGILRDIFTMGARPIAVLDSLRFGPISESSSNLSTEMNLAKQPARDQEIAANRRILDGVIRGIGFYGNCFGVPTVGGEVQFESCYSKNPLVNALALGIAHKDKLFFARAKGPGNPVIFVGAKTGRDGIHGASLLASAEFSEESQQKRPNVQVGDPFMEKLLLEACLEVMTIGAVVAIQDMGAAGLTSSSSEMAARGEMGIELELARVPQREANMTAYEMMLSESQERMLLVAEKGREHEVLAIFAKWGLDAVVIGEVTDTGRLRVLHHGRVAADIPARALAEEAPVYNRPVAPSTTASPQARSALRVNENLIEFALPSTNLTENFKRLLASPAIASKQWIIGQYDHMVRTNTVTLPGAGDAAVLRLKESRRGLALSTDCNGRWCFLNPRVGAMHAVAEAARNVACSGAQPIAATNCLNFGNPERPEVMLQFSEAIEGIREACETLKIPITGGNVSFYNETLGQAIYPTPVMGILGILENVSHALGLAFANEDDAIILLDGATKATSPRVANRDLMLDRREFSSSEYAKTIHGIIAGQPPSVDLPAEDRLIQCLVALAAESAIHSAHDLSDGGLAVAAAECAFLTGANGGNSLSAKIDLLSNDNEPVELALFGERGARAIVSASPTTQQKIEHIAAQNHISAKQIGLVTRGEFSIKYNETTCIADDIRSLKNSWASALPFALRSGQVS